MRCPGERCPALSLPGPRFVTESLPRCPSRSEPFANTCQPLSITKGPAPRWPRCPQTAVPALSPLSPPASLSLPCQPLVQKCVLLFPETSRLLPSPTGVAVTSERPRGDKKRVARSLPPCAPRCPEPGRLRFPPCAVRSSASCRGRCRSRKVPECPRRCPELPLRGGTECRQRCPELRPLSSGYSVPLRGVTECPQRCPELTSGHSVPLRGVTECPQRCPELTGGYSLPLRGVTECPPQPSPAQLGLRECLGTSARLRCSRGYPTQECVPCCPPEQRRGEVITEVTKECPPRAVEVTKGSLQQHEVTKIKVSSSQHLSRSRCPHPRGSPRPSRLSPARVKHSGHSKKSRCASKWLW